MNSLREQSIPDIMIQRSIVFIAVLLAAQQSAMATTFDLHNLGAINAGFKSVTIGGITLTLESEGTGNLVSTSTRFGIDGSGASDATDLIDGGNGTAEQLAFLFSPAVVLDSI